MNSSLLIHRIAVFSRVALAALFIYAGLAKLSEPRTFAASVAMLQIVPFQWTEWIAGIFPMAELLTGLWLIAGWRMRAATLAVMLLAGTFVFTTGQAMIRNLSFNCHCFGVTIEQPPAWQVLTRALLLLALAAFLRRFAIRSERRTGSSLS